MSIELDRGVRTDEGHPSSPQELDDPNTVVPPADKGTGAWLFLLGSFLIEAVIWGFNIAFGVFQEHYSRLPQFIHSSNIPVIGTLATSMVFLGTPFAAPLIRRFHAWRQAMVVAGSVICVLSLVWASFANSVPELIASQGALYGIGVLVVYAPLVSMLNEWFIERRGFAYGVVFAGGGVSGVGLPFLTEWLLATYGYRTALRGIAVAQAVSVVPILPLIKGRLPSTSQNDKAAVEFDFVSNPQFWVLTFSNLFQGFAIYVPSIYLPTFATLAGLSPRMGALLLSAFNIASTLGQVGFGHLSDRFNNIYILVFITTFVSAVASFFVWGYAQSLAPLLAFALLFGLFGGSYVVFWPKFALLSKDHLFLYGLMAFGKGVGNVVTGPITARLLALPASSGYGLGTYKHVIIYTGTLLLASSVGIIGWPLRSSALQKASRDNTRSR
ncbi:hypothetical protein AJ78_08337 [Emergomyces pasteurianus Ep9510]|uniref:Major facilitator superfamily (MFS) profile domain-containing protein n=1 Tax=Emergomyces pasteurianus Ep9510 TaxID=1447872 RepID=A0A1J9Q372_9EURO|nr:hypothetical protein AJ78_08337 [Emergomyces pasteurianus Ep9510]